MLEFWFSRWRLSLIGRRPYDSQEWKRRIVHQSESASQGKRYLQERQDLNSLTHLRPQRLRNIRANQGVNLLCPEGNSQPGHWMRKGRPGWHCSCKYSLGPACLLSFLINVLRLAYFPSDIYSFPTSSQDLVVKDIQQVRDDQITAAGKE